MKIKYDLLHDHLRRIKSLEYDTIILQSNRNLSNKCSISQYTCQKGSANSMGFVTGKKACENSLVFMKILKNVKN